MKGQIQVPSAFIDTFLTRGEADPTDVLDILLTCQTSVLPTDRRAVLHDTGKRIEQRKVGLGLSNVR